MSFRSGAVIIKLSAYLENPISRFARFEFRPVVGY
jgi:hypothetical protein